MLMVINQCFLTIFKKIKETQPKLSQESVSILLKMEEARVKPQIIK